MLNKLPISRIRCFFSFDTIVASSVKRCRNFLKDALRNNGIWILVILFSVFSTSYMMAKSRRHTWGIYSMLGVTGSKLILQLMAENVLTYALGGVISFIALPHLEKLLGYSVSEIKTEQLIAVAILIATMLLVSFLCNRYIMKIQPNEILNQTKEQRIFIGGLSWLLLK